MRVVVIGGRGECVPEEESVDEATKSDVVDLAEVAWMEFLNLDVSLNVSWRRRPHRG